MKSFILSFLLISIASLGFAQTKTETLKVSGECSSCKKKIESTAKKAGASYAVWNVDSKELTVKYNSTSTNTAKIEKAIAAVGYDTPDYKATDAAYKKLDKCCRYDRTASDMKMASCCTDKCTNNKCMKDGKCDKNMACCKGNDCAKQDCCKKM